MRKLTVLFGLVMVALCPANAQAQAECYDSLMAAYDVASLKEGEWVEYETRSEYPGMVGIPTTKSKTACVKADDESVWIESSSGEAVTLYQVRKKDRKVAKAWSGKAGEFGKEMAVKTKPTAPEGTYEMSGTGKVSKEKCAANGKEFDCEKVERDNTMKMNGMEIRSKSTTWSSAEIPFRPAPADAGVKDPLEGKIKWDGDKPSGQGALVKMMSEASGQKTVMQLVGWGTDAKMTLKVK